LKELSKEFESLLKQIEKDIFSEVGYEFNLNSPLQLREVLFVTLDLPQKKQTKKGEPSTDVEVLTDLSKFHVVPEKVLEHRTLSLLLIPLGHQPADLVQVIPTFRTYL